MGGQIVTSEHLSSFLLHARLIGSLEGDGLLLTHGGDDGDADLLARLESGLDVGSDLTLGDLDVVLGGTVREHQVQETLRAWRAKDDRVSFYLNGTIEEAGE